MAATTRAGRRGRDFWKRPVGARGAAGGGGGPPGPRRYTQAVRIILFTGKGGVGKTSVAAATAVRCANAGYRTVVMSTDPAHSLGDSFDIELGTDITPIANNLWAHEVSSLHDMQRRYLKPHEYAPEV